MDNGTKFIRGGTIPPYIWDKLSTFDFSNLFKNGKILACKEYSKGSCEHFFVGKRDVNVNGETHKIIICVSGTYNKPIFWTHPDRKNGYYNLCEGCTRKNCTDIHIVKSVIKPTIKCSIETSSKAPWSKELNTNNSSERITKLCLKLKDLNEKINKEEVENLEEVIKERTEELNDLKLRLKGIKDPINRLEKEINDVIVKDPNLKGIVTAFECY